MVVALFNACSNKKRTETTEKKDTLEQVADIPMVSGEEQKKSLPEPKVEITRAGQNYPDCNFDNCPSGNHPLIDMYCGALGLKGIEIYITVVDPSTNSVSGYSIVNKSRTNFEGTYSKRIHKAAEVQASNIIDVNSSIYTITLWEPDHLLKNGVFKLELDISDIGRTGFGSWVSYDGMLYREIVIVDKLKDL